MVNIDKLRYNWEKPFLDLIEGLKHKNILILMRFYGTKIIIGILKKIHIVIYYIVQSKEYLCFSNHILDKFLDYNEINSSILYFFTKYLKSSLNLREQIGVSGVNIVTVTSESMFEYFKI